MDDGSRSGVADTRENLVGRPHIPFEGSGIPAELRQQVAPDEPFGAGDEDRGYRSAVPSSSSRILFSSRARRWARIRFSSASFEMTVE
jgi:hypothetical protein